MPDPQDMLSRLADPNQASVFDSTMEQVMRRLAQAMQSGELASVAMGATSPLPDWRKMIPRDLQALSSAQRLRVLRDAGEANLEWSAGRPNRPWGVYLPGGNLLSSFGDEQQALAWLRKAGLGQ